MDKKETIIVFCGSQPSEPMAKALERAGGQGYVVHTVSPSDCDPERLAGVQADLVIYNEAGTFDGMSEALDAMVREDSPMHMSGDLESMFTHERNGPSKFNWKKFTKKVESTQRRK